MRLLVPEDQELWPTLGPEVCDWIEAELCHGPGDVLGKPVELTDEARGFVYRCYEVFPKGHPLEGRRRFMRAVLSRRKGWAKTELAAFLAIAEMDPTAPVRCDGFRRQGRTWIPVGRPVRDPYIPMVAVTEEQTEDLAYGAVYEILQRCSLGDDYEIGIEKILHRRSAGKMQPLASAPGGREGARTTFEHFDETHLFISPRLKSAHATMVRNIAKRPPGADAWSLETTTSYAPGESSVAELTHQYAAAVAAGRVKDARLLFDHLQADDSRKITSAKGLRAAIQQASGDAWLYTNPEAIVAMFHDPQQPEDDSRRYWLNQPRKRKDKYLDVDVWDPLAKPKRKVPAGTEVVLGFDGSYNRDSTALIGCTVADRPHVFVVKIWERPLQGPANWRVPRTEVMETVAAAMERYRVVELAPDPPGWVLEVEQWEETYGETVVRFETWQPSRMGPACDDFFQAVHDGRLTHDGNEVVHRHLGNCVETMRAGRRVVKKASDDSPEKIDAATAAIIAHHRAAWHATQGEDVGALLVDPRGEVFTGTCPFCRFSGELRRSSAGVRCPICNALWEE